MAWNREITEQLRIQYPIIQAPMLGITTPEMVAAVANAGGLGSLPAGGLSPEATQQLIWHTKSLTGKSFAVNLFVHDIPSYSEEEIEPMRKFLLELALKRGYKLSSAELSGFKFYSYKEQLDILEEEKISIVSFTFGCPGSESITKFRQQNCLLMGTATCLSEALYLEKQGIDMIIVQGIEAGGHRGTFMDETPLPEIGLFSLLPQVVRQVQVPCIAAGGINNAGTIKAAFDLGAAAVQVGTAFISTEESRAISSYKAKISRIKDTDTALTRAFSGRWARGIRNEMMAEIENSGIPIPPYPVQNSLTAQFRKLAQQAGDSEYTNLWAGQANYPVTGKTTRDVFESLVKDYEARYGS